MNSLSQTRPDGGRHQCTARRPSPRKDQQLVGRGRAHTASGPHSKIRQAQKPGQHRRQEGVRPMTGYAICTAPRSGGDLCQLLAGTGVLGRPLDNLQRPGATLLRRSLLSRRAVGSGKTGRDDGRHSQRRLWPQAFCAPGMIGSWKKSAGRSICPASISYS